MRKAISTKTRFEVFKRDSFTCQYCGAHPPGVLLHVDHIVPVALGGQNHIDNYVTSCETCNLGKGARSLESIPESLKDKAKKIKESEAQINGFQSIMADKRARLEKEAWEIVHLMNPNATEIKKDDFRSIKNFIEKLGFDEVYEAMDIASSKGFKSFARDFKYFCGICINKLRKLSE